MLNDCERISDIAQALGISRTTLWRWRQKREFKNRMTLLALNDKRAVERAMRRFEKERDEYWNKRLAEAEADLQEAVKTGNQRTIDRAWKARETCLFRGLSWDVAEDILWGHKRIRPKIPRAKKRATKSR